MDTKRSVNPILAIVITVIVVVGIGYLGVRMFGSTGGEKQVIVRPANPNAPQFQPDPRLGGGGR